MPDSSANWANRTIWTGDNIEIMRGMNSHSVDLIYLDPPFNSKVNYAAPIGSKAAGAEFKDTWSLSDVDVEWINLIEAKYPALHRVLLAATIDNDKAYLVYMAARLLEMHRILKPSGSIYLHCDPTMSHYLKLVMDAVFGRRTFRNEVIWQRYGSHNDASKYGRVTDTLLFYAGEGATWTSPRLALSDDDIARRYTNKDARGLYTTSPLQARTLSGGGYSYSWKGVTDIWKFPEERLDELESQGRIHWPKKGHIPRRKVYLSENPGKPLSNLWADISIASGKERLGYPTQKPLALLRRVIEASSNPGDVVLDPFCGCATALIAAEKLQRQWIGIDISPKAAELVRVRMRDDLALFYGGAHRTDVPKRTDLGKLPPCQSHKPTLYGLQSGNCAGCAEHFEARHLEVDHIIARAKGGTDHIDNLQLLCGSCNRIKGNRGMEYLMSKLQL